MYTNLNFNNISVRKFTIENALTSMTNKIKIIYDKNKYDIFFNKSIWKLFLFL